MTQPQTPRNEAESAESRDISTPSRRKPIVRRDRDRASTPPRPHAAFAALAETEGASDEAPELASAPAPLELESPLSPAEEQLRAQARQLAGYLRARKRDLERRERTMPQPETSTSPPAAPAAAPSRRSDSPAGPRRFRPSQKPSVTPAAHATQPTSEIELAEQAEQRARLQALEATLREQWVVCERERQDLADARQELAEDARRQQADLAAQRQRMEQELAERAEQARRREERLDVEQAAAEQLRGELNAVHQETLEMRLACEQLWSQLADRMEMPALIRSIAGLRARIAEQHQAAAATLTEQQKSVEQLLERLDQRQKQLRRQRDDLQEWIVRRHEELEVQAAQLLSRQQELQRQERLQREAREQAQQEIRNYQRQVRQLTAQLRAKNELSRVA